MEKHCELLGYSINQKECDVTKDMDFHECENCGEKKPMKKEIKDTGRRKVSRGGVVCSDCGKKASDDQYFRFSRGKCCVCVSRDDRAKKKGIKAIEGKPTTKKERKAKASPLIRIGPTKDGGIILSISFSEHPELYRQIEALAKQELRTPENQIIYFLKHGDFNGLSKQV